MPLITAALVPNLSLLAPGVTKDSLLTYGQTLSAYQELADSLQKQKIETIVIMSNRGLSPELGMAINVQPKFNINFEEFGDFATKLVVDNDLALVDHLQNNLSQAPLSMLSLVPLDYGSAVPMVYFLQSNPKLKVVPIYPSNQSLYKQSELGASLGQILHSSSERVALIASVNLSSRLASSPLGYLPKAKGYDKKIINGLETHDYRFLYGLLAEEISTYYEQGLAPLAMLAGAITRFKKTVKTLSYEHPQGLGAALLEVKF